MLISRFCGHERLPGGARRWKRLARRAKFTGTLRVFGYGVHGAPGKAQRRAERDSKYFGVTLADFQPNLIRVWLKCSCQAVEELPTLAEDLGDDPLASFAHELGHHMLHVRGRNWYNEAAAERFGRLLLAHVP